jgi:hypothetical protein
LYDLEKALTKLREQTWLVRQHQDDIHEGDVVYLWIAGKGSGIIARAIVKSEPQDSLADPAEEEFTIDPEKFGGMHGTTLISICFRAASTCSLVIACGIIIFACLELANIQGIRLELAQICRYRQNSQSPFPQCAGSQIAGFYGQPEISISFVILEGIAVTGRLFWMKVETYRRAAFFLTARRINGKLRDSLQSEKCGALNGL